MHGNRPDHGRLPAHALEVIATACSDAVIVEDRHGIVRWAAPRAAAWFGTGAADLAGTAVDELLRPDLDAERATDRVTHGTGPEPDTTGDATRGTTRDTNGTLWRCRPVGPGNDREPRWVRRSTRTLHDESGHPAGAVVLLQDMTGLVHAGRELADIEERWQRGVAVSAEGSLGAFVALLADSPDGDVVARAVAGGLLAPFGPTTVTVHVAAPGRRDLDLAAHVGLEPDQARLYARIPVDARLPLAEVFRSGEELALTLPAVAEQYPLAARWVRAGPDGERAELVAVPIRSRAVPIGVLTLQFPAPPERTWRLRSALDTTAHALALWVLARADQTVRHGTAEVRPGDLRITERQREILRLVRSGCTNREIAGRIRFSEATVRAELASLSRLLGARGRHDVVDKAADAGV